MDTVADIFDSPFFDDRARNESARATNRISANEAENDALMIRAAGGDDEAFRQLVERHQERVYRFCFQWLRQSEDAREACQDTFVRVYQSMARYRAQGQFTSWLLRIALNQCRDRYRSRASKDARCTEVLFADESSEPTCHRATPAEAVSLSADVEKIREGIDLLPAKLREVLIICAVEGYRHDQCAEILGCSERAVEGRLYRARKALEAWWEAEKR